MKILNFISLLSLILFTISLDNHTLSNYKDITLTNLTGIIHPDFDEKIVEADFEYTFKANNEGKNIILDSKYLNIISIFEISPQQKNLSFYYGEKDKILGTPLVIEREFQQNDTIIINIKYNTTKNGTSAQFLSVNQTIDKTHPYFFTQSEMTVGRELLPSQDTPAVKFPFYLGIKVMNPLRGLISGLYERNETNDDDNTTTYYYYQKIPIPNYLVSFAAGNIIEQKLNDQISIYSEPGFINKAVQEFNDTPKFLEYAIEYMGEYQWGKYNVLVVPYSFPYSGMENPCLTFSSPCLINGDKSLVDLIAHELIHSWSGNLVTNENWRDFWLNEGITKFLQRKVIAKWQNDDYAKMDYLLGLSYIAKYLKVFGINSTFTSLRPNLTGIWPDETFSNIPYEKGSNFVYYLEDMIGKELMQKFFKSYFVHFQKMSIDVFDFKNYFIQFCEEHNVTNETLGNIKWQEWIFEPGDCPVPNNFSNKYNDELNKTMEKFINEDFNGLKEQFNKMIASAKTVFFLRLEERNIFLTQKQHEFLTNTLELYHNQNYLVTTHYLRLILKETTEFLPNEYECLYNYLTSFGVSDFMDGVYRLFYKRDEIKSVEVLNSCSGFYHNIMMNMAKNEIEDAKTHFPIISFEFENQCLTPENGDKINIISNEYNEYKNNFGEIDVNDGIKLKSENSEINLQCHLDSNKTYCSINDQDFKIDNNTNYTILVPKRIQQKEFAIKQFESTKKYNLHLKNKISSNNPTSIMNDYKINKTQDLIINFDVLNNYEKSIIITKGDIDLNCEFIYEQKKIKCIIDQTNFNYDKKNGNEYKKYVLKINDICGKEIHSVDVFVKNSEETKHNTIDDEGLKGWQIALICVGAVIIVILIGFFVFRNLRRKKTDSEEDEARLLKDD